MSEIQSQAEGDSLHFPFEECYSFEPFEEGMNAVSASAATAEADRAGVHRSGVKVHSSLKYYVAARPLQSGSYVRH